MENERRPVVALLGFHCETDVLLEFALQKHRCRLQRFQTIHELTSFCQSVACDWVILGSSEPEAVVAEVLRRCPGQKVLSLLAEPIAPESLIERLFSRTG
jgi:hypothetical protein